MDITPLSTLTINLSIQCQAWHTLAAAVTLHLIGHCQPPASHATRPKSHPMRASARSNMSSSNNSNAAPLFWHEASSRQTRTDSPSRHAKVSALDYVIRTALRRTPSMSGEVVCTSTSKGFGHFSTRQTSIDVPGSLHKTPTYTATARCQPQGLLYINWYST